MDEVVKKYNTSRYDECVHLLSEKLKEDNSLVENITIQNSINVCRCLIIISNCDIRKINDMQLELHKNYEIIIATGLTGTILPLQLELTTFLNFIWWNVYYVHSYNEDFDRMKYLPVIQKGLRRVLGMCSKVSKSPNQAEDILLDMQNYADMDIKDVPTAFLVCEIFELILLNCLQVDQSLAFIELCLESTNKTINYMEMLTAGLIAVKDFASPCTSYEKLFKFGFPKINNTVSNYSGSIDNLYVIKCLCSFMGKKYESVLQILRENLKCTGSSLLCYLGALSCFMLEDLSQCLGFLNMSNGLECGGELKSRINILLGRALSRKGDHKKALKCFKEAVECSPHIPATYYYMGEEYGKMGLDDDMIECFQNLARIKNEERLRKNTKCSISFETLILDLLHPAEEITESEANYAVSVALGLCERFQESAETFEKYFEVLDLDRKDRLAGERIIETQNVVTALHEHATMSMLAGNMLTTESVLSKASELYKKVEYSGKKPKEGVHVSKDIDWLNKLLEGELGVALNKEKKEEQNWFTEEMVYFFDEDIIGLMLSAEAQIRQGMESCKITIGKLMVIFAKYFAQMNKKEIIEEDEKICSTLTGALAAKVCLEVVRRRVKSECQAAETERMLRRALNCNESDKDVLHEYCKFLQAEGRLRDAQKLWQSLYEKETSVSVNYCQSLALRYLLRSNVTRRDLEKIQLELNSNEIDIDLERLNINEI